MNAQVIERLEAGLAHLRQYGWGQELFYDSGTKQACALGALYHGGHSGHRLSGHAVAFELANWSLPAENRARKYLLQALPPVYQAIGEGRRHPVAAWNDAKGRTQAEVEALFERAILLATMDLPDVHENAPATALAASGA